MVKYAHLLLFHWSDPLQAVTYHFSLSHSSLSYSNGFISQWSIILGFSNIEDFKLSYFSHRLEFMAKLLRLGAQCGMELVQIVTCVPSLNLLVSLEWIPKYRDFEHKLFPSEKWYRHRTELFRAWYRGKPDRHRELCRTRQSCLNMNVDKSPNKA